MNIETWIVPFEAYCGSEPYIFISYAHKDHDMVFNDINCLHKSGYRIWYDEGIDPGNEWAEMVEKYLLKCSLFIVFITDNAVESENVRGEISLALETKKKFIAIHLRETELKYGLRVRMGIKQAILKYRMDTEIYYRKLDKVLLELSIKDNSGELAETLKFSKTVEQTASKSISFDAGVYDKLNQYNKQAKWEKIREIGPQYLDFLVKSKYTETNLFNLVLKLINLGVYLTDAKCHVSAKKCMDETVDLLLKLIKQNEEDIEYLDYLGMTYNNMGRLARITNSTSRNAESFYRKSVDIFNKLYPVLSDDVDLGDRLGMAYQNLGNALKAQGKVDGAKEAYQSAVATYEAVHFDFPDNTRIRNKLEESKQLFNSIHE